MPLADIGGVVWRSLPACRPPPRLTLSEWADRYFVLSPEMAAEPGPWKTLPYQRGILDAITDPAIERVSLMKSARIGYTLCASAAIAYHMHHDPSSMLVVQPTVDDAKSFSKETIAPMLRDVPVLADILFREVEDKGPKDANGTLTHKAFPGGILSLVGANTGTGFRRISRRLVFFDEVDAYPPSAGSEGDPIRLGTMRTQAFWNRKIIAGSTPLLAGASRIEELFLAGDQRRFHVPCPQCGAMDFLAFTEGDHGHWFAWPEGRPEEAHFICRENGCVIEHRQKREMVSRGEWIPAAQSNRHASFAIWAAYSWAPNATWADIAREYEAAKKEGPEKERTFTNTWLGEPYQEKGEAPEWRRLFDRRERYQIGTVPEGVRLLTAGVDVQRDRLVYEVVGWGEDKQSWSIDAAVIPGKTDGEAPWNELGAVLDRVWLSADGTQHTIRMMAVDSGDQTQRVYSWCRTKPMNRVIAVKGTATSRALICTPSSVDVQINGKRMARGYKVWLVGAALAKSELYGQLGLDAPTKPGETYPAGYCHLPEYGEDFFKQLTAEHLVKKAHRTGFATYEWQVLSGRENHFLDCRIYARAAAALVGLDRLAARRIPVEMMRPPTPVVESPAPKRVEPAPHSPAPPAPRPVPRPPRKRREGGWLGGSGRRGSWL